MSLNKNNVASKSIKELSGTYIVVACPYKEHCPTSVVDFIIEFLVAFTFTTTSES